MTLKEGLLNELEDLLGHLDREDEESKECAELIEDYCRHIIDLAVKINFVCRRYEQKLREIMTANEFDKLSSSAARQLNKMYYDEMPEGEFKDFVKKIMPMEDYKDD